jgi:cysteinyl-tRNA synthetase
MTEARNVLDRLYRAVGDAAVNADAIDSDVVAALCDDLNTPAAMARLHELAGAANKGDGDAATALKTNAGLLGLLGQTADQWAKGVVNLGTDFSTSSSMQANIEVVNEEIDRKISARNQARADRDFAAADAIRDELAAGGIILEDGPDGTIWRRA